MSQEHLNHKRGLILRAAAKVFAKNGFHQAKIEDIALQAGIGKGTVYEYYRSKEQLFRETIKAAMDYHSLQLTAEVSREKSAYDKLKAFIRLCLSQAGNVRTFIRITMNDGSLIKDINDKEFQHWLSEMHEKQFAVLEGIIREGIDRGEIRPVNTRLFARLFSGSIGFLLNPLTTLDISDKSNEEIAAEVLSFYFLGLACHQDQEKI